ncbi:MAG: hypothetical protein VX461_03705 [Candidatus Thermoplasmatota archaeon]|nr:hypothetical protein [Candidatus Thermoplasmatota archaeon]
MSSEFKMFGMTVPQIAIMDGAILSAWGLIAYSIQSADPPSITAMIPAFFGFPMLALGLFSVRNPANKHHYMHASMVFALLMALGGARIATTIDGMSWLGIVSHLLLLLVGVSFMVVGIMSFRSARIERESSVIE